ncbi:Crp/Fnr family transcriptional regulator [Lactonifactor longoviformis]|uniref:Crp/Fnr family transcriptional regulator n=1 Tax=Lactonifactor longoviformis TaxID=341220 RepID=UPI0036F1DC4C
MYQKELQKDFQELLPFWKSISSHSQETLINHSEPVTFPPGTAMHAGGEECSGLFLVLEGRVRAYIVTEQGKEVTLFRLLSRDICIFSASCIMKNISFDVFVSAETEVRAIRIPAQCYNEITNSELAVARYTNELLSSRMSDVMWVLEEIVFTSFDKRLAHFLLEEGELEESDVLTITHEQIANHLGSAREVVSRMLRYFANEGYVKAERGSIRLLDKEGLEEI